MNRARYITHNGTSLDEVLQRIMSRIDDIEHVLDELERRAGQLRSQWSGEAAASYDRAHIAWDRSLRELHGIARQLTGIATGASARFTAHDQAEARVWQF